MDLTESILETEYRDEGYSDHHNSIDAQSAIEFNCEKCNAKMRYIGLKHQDLEEFSGQSAVSYIAISHCDNCGHEFEF